MKEIIVKLYCLLEQHYASSSYEFKEGFKKAIAFLEIAYEKSGQKNLLLENSRLQCELESVSEKLLIARKRLKELEKVEQENIRLQEKIKLKGEKHQDRISILRRKGEITYKGMNFSSLKPRQKRILNSLRYEVLKRAAYRLILEHRNWKREYRKINTPEQDNGLQGVLLELIKEGTPNRQWNQMVAMAKERMKSIEV